MRPGTCLRLSVAASFLCLVSCRPEPPVDTNPPGTSPKFPDSSKMSKPQPNPIKKEIAAQKLEAVLRAHLQGLGHMERYEYDKAARYFQEVHERAPGWVPGSINLAIALLNLTGTEDEHAKQNRAAAAVPRSNFEQALTLVDDVLVRDPANLHAHYCRGIILEYLGQMAQAHEDFVFVAEHDPSDGHAWFKVGSTLCDPDNPDRPAGPDQAKQLIEIYTKALERNPYLVNALFKLQAAYAWAGDREKQKELLERWRNLNPKSNPVGSGDLAETFYGEMGRYARIIDPILAFKSVEEASPKLGVESVKSRTFQLPQGHRWVSRADFKGPLAVVGRARDRCGAAVATFDADGDGNLDIYLCAGIIGPMGVRDALLINHGQGRFEDSTAAFGLPDDRVSLGVAAGDFDADRRIDLFVTGVGSNRLYRNLGKKFEDVTQSAGLHRATHLEPDGALARPGPRRRSRSLRDQLHGPRPCRLGLH